MDIIHLLKNLHCTFLLRGRDSQSYSYDQTQSSGVSINCESARYKELKENKFYIPVDWDVEEQNRLQKHCEECFEKYHSTLSRLSPILGRKRAKESARFYLPYATQLVFDVMFNFRSFMHFQKLRNVSDAQLEIQQIAKKMLELVKNTNQFNYSITAFKL